MRSFLLFTLLLVSVQGFSQLRKAPDWVRQPPLSDQAYYGVGFANPQLHENPRQHARQLALRDMAEKIIVSVDASSELKVLSVNDQISYQLNESVKLASSSFLSGYELLGEWSSRKGDAYYVLFRLDKAVYQENLTKYYDQLFALVDMKASYAQRQVASGHMVVGMNELAAGISKLQKELEGSIDPTYAKMLEIKKLSLVHQLEAYLTRLSFKMDPMYEVDLSHPQPLVLSDYLIDRVTGLPVRQLEVALRPTHGDVFDFEFHQNTLHDELQINGFYPLAGEARFRLQARLPFARSVRDLVDPVLIQRLTSQEVRLQFVPYTIQIIASDRNDEVLADYLRVVTADLGLVEDSVGHAIEIYVDVKDELQSTNYGAYDASFEGKVSIYEKGDAFPSFQHTLTGNSYGASNRQEAISAAYNDSLTDPTQFLSGFVTQLCTK